MERANKDTVAAAVTAARGAIIEKDDLELARRHLFTAELAIFDLELQPLVAQIEELKAHVNKIRSRRAALERRAAAEESKRAEAELASTLKKEKNAARRKARAHQAAVEAAKEEAFGKSSG